MEKFYLEKPSIKRKEAAIEFINEFYEYNSEINGAGGLQRYLDNYEEWLYRWEKYAHMVPSEERVPSVTYFLVRNSDNRIVGIIDIRLVLNESLRRGAGHIGYSIRPTERRKGYNKINLYLGLKKCLEYGIDKVLLNANINNIASWKTMEALGGKRMEEYINSDGIRMVHYEIDVLESIKNNIPNGLNNITNYH